jgi:hypothetical protein
VSRLLHVQVAITTRAGQKEKTKQNLTKIPKSVNNNKPPHYIRIAHPRLLQWRHPGYVYHSLSPLSSPTVHIPIVASMQLCTHSLKQVETTSFPNPATRYASHGHACSILPTNTYLPTYPPTTPCPSNESNGALYPYTQSFATHNTLTDPCTNTTLPTRRYLQTPPPHVTKPFIRRYYLLNTKTILPCIPYPPLNTINYLCRFGAVEN